MKIYFVSYDLKTLLMDLEHDTRNEDLNKSIRKLREKLIENKNYRFFLNLEFTDYLLIKYIKELYRNFEFDIEFG